MESILQEIKQKVETLISEYKIKDISIWIDDGIKIENLSSNCGKTVVVEVRI